MVDIPPEIWLHIARFIPNEILRDLSGVNSLFFDIGMNLRWKEVLIITRNTSGAMHILDRLSDPFVARRVRHLILRLTLVKEPNVEAAVQNPRPLKQQIQHTLQRVFKASSSKKEIPTAESNIRPRPTFSDVMSAFIAITPNLVGVRDLNMDSWDLPPTYDLRPLFTSIWSTFGTNLHGLFLGGNLEGYRVLIQSKPTLPRVKDLRVEFTNNLFRLDQEADAAILVNVLAPFINSLSPHLEVLRIWSWAFLDISRFFELLGHFPVLRSLNIRMAFNKALHEPSGLKTFLCRCSNTLQRLELRLNPSGLPMNPTSEEPLSQWLMECMSDETCFVRLRALDIYPTSMVAGMSALLACIDRTSRNLVELTVRDRYFQPAEAKTLVEAASKCSNLRYLRMNVGKLDVVLLDFMAEKVPNVTRLWMSIGETLNNNAGGGGLVDTFYRDLKRRSYTDWKLKDITIWQGGQEMDSETMRALAHSIPSVKSFFGNGHMVLDRSEEPASPSLST